MKLLITGANGFVGAHLCRYFGAVPDYEVVGAVRESRGQSQMIAVGDISEGTDWQEALHGCDAVIHCAGQAGDNSQASDMDGSKEIADTCYAVNYLATRRLLECARDSGVKKFIYFSSVKVHGECTKKGRSIAEHDPFKPSDRYAKSKVMTEQFIATVAKSWSMDIIVIRPPLIYGPGVKGNFRTLLKLANTAYPLPFGAIRAPRSMLSVYNLADFVDTCLRAKPDVSGAFLVSDNENLSVSALVSEMRRVMGRPARLLPVPKSFFVFVVRILLGSDKVKRLTGDLVVSSGKARQELSWNPPHPAQEAIKKTAEHFLTSSAKVPTQ